jgi:hypothetical protein
LQFDDLEAKHKPRGRFDSVCVDTITSFRDEWEEEFQKSQFARRTFRAASCIGAVFFMFQFLMQMMAGADGEAGGDMWFFATWSPQLVCGLMYAATAAAFTIDACRPFCMRHYDLLCAVTIVASCAGCAATYVFVEARRALFQNPDFPHIRWGVDYASGWPRRTCADADPARTWSFPPEHSISSNGCNNLVLSGGAFCLYVHLNLLPLIYRLRAATAARVAAANAAVLSAAVAAVGSATWVLASALACQLAAGGLAAHLCRRRAALARRQFAVSKGIRRASERRSLRARTSTRARAHLLTHPRARSGSLLYTLIPRNVVAQLASWRPAAGGEMLGQSLPCATVMFWYSPSLSLSNTHGSECGRNRPGFGWQAVSQKLRAIQYYRDLNIVN